MSNTIGAELALTGLFEYLPDVFHYVKDREGRFVAANENLWRMRGCESQDEMLGKTDLDLHPRYLAERYMAEDQAVMESGKPLPNQVWLVPSNPGELKWFISSKMPLRSTVGDVIGIAGVMRDLEKAKSVSSTLNSFEKFVSYVLGNYDTQLWMNSRRWFTFRSVSLTAVLRRFIT